MGRTDDDEWGVTEGDGATTMGMALARAAETSSGATLFHDPYAQHCIDAAIAQGWTPPHTDASLAQLGELDTSAGKFVRAMTDYSLCRTRFFDEFFRAATADASGRWSFLLPDWTRGRLRRGMAGRTRLDGRT
jgi:O-methyltransferase involved in polyketide biosynthesis